MILLFSPIFYTTNLSFRYQSGTKSPVIVKKIYGFNSGGTITNKRKLNWYLVPSTSSFVLYRYISFRLSTYICKTNHTIVTVFALDTLKRENDTVFSTDILSYSCYYPWSGEYWQPSLPLTDANFCGLLQRTATKTGRKFA